MATKHKLIAICWLAILLLGSCFAQSGPPAEECRYDGIRGNDSLRMIAGTAPAPFYVGCAEEHSRADESGCVKDSLPVGLITSVDREKNGWSCVAGKGSLSGWVPDDHLGPLSLEGALPISEWLGWWRYQPVVKGLRIDRILIQRKKDNPGILVVSGRAYWYGPAVHVGQFVGEAAPVGRHLHIVDSATDFGGCVVNLTIERSANGAVLSASDNEHCGGMNVRFSGRWHKYTPRGGMHQR